MIRRFLASELLPPLTLLWLALLQGPNVWGGFCLGLAVMMTADIFLNSHEDNLRRRAHGN